MKRRWNGLVWSGFAVTLLAALSYVPVFARFPITRDLPWANLLLFVAGLLMLGAGVKRAFGQPERYRGKISGTVMGVLAFFLFVFFCWGVFVFTRNLPPASTALHAGQQAPYFTLTDAGGKPVELKDQLQANRAVLLVFYRGYW